MGHDQKFRQRWEFRRKESYSDSSSDGPQSGSSSEPVLKKHKPTSMRMMPRITGVGNFTRLQKRRTCVPGTMGRSKDEKVNKKPVKWSKKQDEQVHNEMKDQPSSTEANKMMNKGIAIEHSLLGDTQIFMESILEELKIARENMIIWMREEMQKIVGEDDTQRPTEKESSYKQEMVQAHPHNSFKLDLDARTCNSKSLVCSVKRKRTKSSRDCSDLVVPVTLPEQGKGIMSDASVKKPVLMRCPEQVVSPMYLTLPTVLPESCVKTQNFESHSCNYFQTQVASNVKAVSEGKANLTVDSSIHCGHITHVQEEKCSSIARMCSEGFVGENKFNLGSNAGTCFPLSLHDLDEALKLQSQINLGNLSEVQNNVSDPGMNGSIRSDRGTSGLSELYNAIGIHSHLNFKSDGVPWTYVNSVPRS